MVSIGIGGLDMLWGGYHSRRFGGLVQEGTECAAGVAGAVEGMAGAQLAGRMKTDAANEPSARLGRRMMEGRENRFLMNERAAYFLFEGQRDAYS